jgi:hypothetical protein
VPQGFQVRAGGGRGERRCEQVKVAYRSGQLGQQLQHSREIFSGRSLESITPHTNRT